jgi:tetratricopeptide (TPR) repeat protein
LFSGKAPYKYLILLGLILILTCCSVERNTSTTRFYHGLTSRFNIYFNGYESYKAGLAKIYSGYHDDYAELLQVFEFSDPSTAQLCSSDMERAIQKASKLIALKSITAKPEFKNKRDLSESEKKLLEQKEFNEWVDDSYFLIGKARFFKHEFNDATSLFDYCIAEANDPEIKAESSIWLARINNETGNYTASQRLLKEIDLTRSSSKSFKAMYYSTLADMYIKQKNYAEAAGPLSESIRYFSGKRQKYRLTYLLAQVCERTGEAAKATSYYREVVKMNPPYDVEFNARINIAGVFDINSGNQEDMARELERMLRDVKNIDFQDQIYYALGNLRMKEGKEKEAIECYRESASAKSSNLNQKGKSYLALAEYFYKKPDYINAGKFYDSTVYFLDQKYPDYNELRTKSQNLDALVKELNTIQTEDSLQNVASMTTAERDVLIAGIIEKIVKAESEGKRSEYADRYNIGQYYENERRFEDNISQEGKWYFYNQAALTFGRTEFRRRWGERKLEDNWRRVNKTKVNVQLFTNNQDEEGQKKPDTAKAINDYKKPEFYLKNLPLTDSLIAISNQKIADAYFNSAKIFYDRFKDPQNSAASYELLLSRYPAHELVPEVLYELYGVNKDINGQKSEAYRQRLLEKFPESEFAKILSDPDYYNKKTAHIKLIEQLYQSAYNAYSSENFSEAINICNNILSEHAREGLAPKVMLLRAYSTARISDERGLKAELERLIKEWPDTPEGKKAAELADYLDKRVPDLRIEEDKEIAQELYVSDTTSLYIFALIISDPAFNINQASFDVISHNIDNFTDKNYRTEGLLVNNSYIMITVSGFSDNKEAWRYYDSFKPDRIIRNISSGTYMTFLINNNNLKALEKDKNPGRYFIFFREKYTGGGKL